MSRVEIADRATEERDHSAAVVRDLGQVMVEIPDDEVKVEPVELLRKRVGRTAKKFVADVERDVSLQSPGVLEGGEDHARLVTGTGAQLDEGVRLRQSRDRPRVRLQQGPFCSSRVVLGELGDLLEEATASLVVEPDRWNRFLDPLEAAQSVSPHLGPDDLLREMYVDRVGHGLRDPAPAGHRRMASGRRAGRSFDRWRGRDPAAWRSSHPSGRTDSP